jgi:transcriptional regulator with XRE-family HTH domain
MRFTKNEVSGFAALLTDARSAAGLTRDQVAERVDGLSSAQQLYNYEHGRRVPDRVEVIVALEEALQLRPGTLCRALGFAPLDVEAAPATVADAIAADAGLDQHSKEQLLSAYRAVAE